LLHEFLVRALDFNNCIYRGRIVLKQGQYTIPEAFNNASTGPFVFSLTPSEFAWTASVVRPCAKLTTSVMPPPTERVTGPDELMAEAWSGVPGGGSAGLALLGWEGQYPAVAPDYVTGLCVDGGPYDLRPGTSNNWPWG